MKSKVILILTVAALACLAVSCDKDVPTPADEHVYGFAYVSNLNELMPDELPVSRKLADCFVPVKDGQLLPYDGTHLFVKFDFVEDCYTYWYYSSMAAIYYGQSGWCFGFSYRDTETHKSGKVTITYDNGEDIRFSHTVTLTYDPYGDHEYVDLGLSVKWATCNLGAEKPEEFGTYYAWGEIGGYGDKDVTYSKTDFSWNSYQWCKGSKETLTKYNNNSSYGSVDNITALEMANDAASCNWGGNWRIPSYNDWYALFMNCDWDWVEINGKRGLKFTSTLAGYEGRSIFIPAAGCRSGGFLSDDLLKGYYWTSELYQPTPYCAKNVTFDSESYNHGNCGRYNGMNIRAVAK